MYIFDKKNGIEHYIYNISNMFYGNTIIVLTGSILGLICK